MVQSDPHPTGKYRVIGPLSNLPEFQQAFGCAPPPHGPSRREAVRGLVSRAVRVLVLDDDARRHEWFDAHLTGHDSVWSAEHARRALGDNPRYDLVFLDHDLAVDYAVVPAVWGEDGRTVARFIAGMPEDRRPPWPTSTPPTGAGRARWRPSSWPPA